LVGTKLRALWRSCKDQITSYITFEHTTLMK
jgi:hypothetical protein